MEADVRSHIQRQTTLKPGLMPKETTLRTDPHCRWCEQPRAPTSFSYNRR